MMLFNRIITGLILIVMPMFAYAETIDVEVQNIMVSRGGNVMVLLFTETGFPIEHHQAVAVQDKSAETERMKFSFTIPSFEYIAFKVLHDEDTNNKVTKNWTGIWPKEGLGFSNNQKMGLLGPPDFDKAKLAVANLSGSISLIVTYP